MPKAARAKNEKVVKLLRFNCHPKSNIVRLFDIAGPSLQCSPIAPARRRSRSEKEMLLLILCEMTCHGQL